MTSRSHRMFLLLVPFWFNLIAEFLFFDFPTDYCVKSMVNFDVHLPEFFLLTGNWYKHNLFLWLGLTFPKNLSKMLKFYENLKYLVFRSSPWLLNLLCIDSQSEQITIVSFCSQSSLRRPSDSLAVPHLRPTNAQYEKYSRMWPG